MAEFDKEEFLGLLRKYFEVSNLSSDWDSMREAEPEMLVYSEARPCDSVVVPIAKRLTFDKLTDVYNSGTEHEEDQP